MVEWVLEQALIDRYGMLGRVAKPFLLRNTATLSNFGSPRNSRGNGSNSLSRRARPLEILGRFLNDVLFSRELPEEPEFFIFHLTMASRDQNQRNRGLYIYSHR